MKWNKKTVTKIRITQLLSLILLTSLAVGGWWIYPQDNQNNPKQSNGIENHPELILTVEDFFTEKMLPC